MSGSSNADFNQRVAVATDALPWVERGGFAERLLELAGDRFTALFQVPAGATVPLAPHGYFDLLILDGALRDHHGRHPARTHLRDRAGTVLTSEGATVLIKQRFHGQVAPLRIDTTRSPFRPSYDGYVGVEFSDLVRDETGAVVLMRLVPDASIPTHRHDLGEEFFVLEGSLSDERGTYTAGHWVREPPGSEHAITSEQGALTFIFAHHLA